MPVPSSVKNRLNHNGDKSIGMALNNLNEIVHNALMSRQQWLQRTLGGDSRRDLDAECGYPVDIDAYAYRRLYDRDAIAARVVEVMPLESWKVPPSVYEDEDSDTITAFEEAWDGLAKTVRGQSWYEDEEGSPIWDAIIRADIASGIGSYGALLIGIDDGLPPIMPAAGVEEHNSYPIEQYVDEADKQVRLRYPKGEWTVNNQPGPKYTLVVNKEVAKGRKLVSLMPFDEASATVTQWETNRSSPRYGMPVMYSINFNDPTSQSTGGIGMPMSTENVHWTRVIHIADTSGQASNSTVTAPPRMRAVYNRLLDLCKLYGGSAEMYWQGAFPGLSAETHPQLGGDVDVDVGATQDQLENYMNTLQRYLITSGLNVKTLSPTVVDPTPQINIHIEAICIKIAVPVPVFKGYEIGEQASENNDDSWDDRVRGRQTNYVIPRLIVPFVDRLIMMGVLPEPKEGYHVKYPDADTLSELDQANVGLIKTQALAAYISGGVEAIMPPMDFYTRILGMSDEEAQSVYDNVEEHLEESYPETEDTTTPGAVPTDPAPEPPPGSPIKMKEGEKLVGPGGEKLPAKAPPKQTLVAASQVGNVFCPTGEGGGVDSSCGKDGANKLKSGERFDVGKEHYATVTSVDKEDQSIGGELATRVVYYDNKTNKPVGNLVLSQDKNTWIIGVHELDGSVRGQGLGRKLIPQLVETLGIIESDAIHTESARKMWESIGGERTKSGTYKIFR